MILITTYYIAENEERNIEINKCLQKNYENNYIKRIYLLNNKIYDLKYKSKIIQIKISDDNNYKLKYNDVIKFINKNLCGNICILANSDIYFDKSLFKINRKIIYNNCFALLRYDEDGQIFSKYNCPRNDSQDSWIFQSPLNIDINKLNFSFGTLGCDSIFANIIYEANNIKISNPCYDIITIHVHKTEYRTYNEDSRIHGKYCLLPPCNIGNIPELLFINY